MPRARNRHYGIAAFLTLTLLASPAAVADGTDFSNMHWAFSAFFGSGWYEISDSESVFIVRTPFSQEWSRSSLSEGRREPGIEFLYPLSVGLHNVDSLDDFADVDSFGTLAFTPGIEVEIPVTGHWYLRPLAHFGWGTATDGGDSAWIYYGGIKSRYTPELSNGRWSVLNALYRAGYHSENGDRGSITMAMAGAEFRHPIAAQLADGEALQLNWHLTYSWLFDEAEFSLRSGFSQSVDDQWELGIALAPRQGDFRLWKFAFAQLGLSFRASSNGDYRAIGINFSSPFH